MEESISSDNYIDQRQAHTILTHMLHQSELRRADYMSSLDHFLSD